MRPGLDELASCFCRLGLVLTEDSPSEPDVLTMIETIAAERTFAVLRGESLVREPSV